MELSVIIVNYNTKDLLKTCIDSVKKSCPDCQIIVVDNCSDDGSREEILKMPVKGVLSESNLGFSRANNLGLKEATGENILFLNPDTLVDEGTLKRCLEFIKENRNVGALGCRVVLPDGTLDKACKRKFPTPFNSFCTIFKLAKIFPCLGYNVVGRDREVYQVDCLVGAFMMCPKAVLEKVSGFDEDFFMYGEDIDLCYRIKKSGFDIWYLGDAKITHIKGASGKKSKIAKSAFYDSMSIYYKKHFKEGFFTKLVDLAVKIMKKL